MDDSLKTCSCGAHFTEAQSSGKHCFKCKIASVGWTWRGPTRASKQNFHDNTIAGVIRESVRAEKVAGTSADIQPVGARWV